MKQKAKPTKNMYVRLTKENYNFVVRNAKEQGLSLNKCFNQLIKAKRESPWS